MQWEEDVCFLIFDPSCNRRAAITGINFFSTCISWMWSILYGTSVVILLIAEIAQLQELICLAHAQAECGAFCTGQVLLPY